MFISDAFFDPNFFSKLHLEKPFQDPTQFLKEADELVATLTVWPADDPSVSFRTVSGILLKMIPATSRWVKLAHEAVQNFDNISDSKIAVDLDATIRSIATFLNYEIPAHGSVCKEEATVHLQRAILMTFRAAVERIHKTHEHMSVAIMTIERGVTDDPADAAEVTVLCKKLCSFLQSARVYIALTHDELKSKHGYLTIK